MTDISLISIPFDLGAGRLGCRMGPDALNVAKLPDVLTELGHNIAARHHVEPKNAPELEHANDTLKNLGEVVTWTEAIANTAEKACANTLPIFMGGDHTIAAGTVSGVARAAKKANKPLFVLWLDAHTDFHNLNTTDSGNLHGTPVAYFTGQEGFDAYPELKVAVPEENVTMLGLRSVDQAENARIRATKITAHDMRAVDEHGMIPLLRRFIAQVQAADGWLHVSLDVDFLDPQIAPAVGTTVPGGATFREAHLIMETLHETGLVRSLDIVELNPFLDDRGKTAKLLVDLTASLFGKRIMDRPTRSY